MKSQNFKVNDHIYIYGLAQKIKDWGFKFFSMCFPQFYKAKSNFYYILERNSLQVQYFLPCQRIIGCNCGNRTLLQEKKWQNIVIWFCMCN